MASTLQEVINLKKYCLYCGKELKMKPSRLKDAKFCNRTCYSKYKTKNEFSIYICKQCGKEFKQKSYQLPRKYCSNECKGKAIGGKNHYNWKNGRENSPYPYSYNSKFRMKVRNFWDNKCGLCGKPETNGNGLSIHHVQYDKKVETYDPNALFIPLCNKCHSKTNHNRKYWEDYFTNYIMIYNNGICR